MRINLLKQKIDAVISLEDSLNAALSHNKSTEESSDIRQAIADLADEIYNNYIQSGNKFLIQFLRSHDANLLAAAHIYQAPAQLPANDTIPAIVVSFSEKNQLTQSINRLTYYVGSVTLTIRQGTARIYSEQASVKAFGDSTVYAYGHTYVENNNQATALLYDNSRCRAKGGTIYASDHSFVQEEEPATIHLFGYSGGYFPYGSSQINASESAQLLYSPSSRLLNRPTVELSDKAILLLDNPNEYPINIIRQSRYSTLVKCQEQHIDPKDYLAYLHQRNTVPNTTNCTQRAYNLESLKRKVSRYIQKQSFLLKLSVAKDEEAIIRAMIPYLPETIGQQGMTSNFLRTHFKKETLLAHNIYAYDDTPYIPNRPNQPDQPIFLFGTQIGLFSENEHFYTYEQSFAIATGQARGTLNGQSRCIAKEQTTIVAKDLSRVYASDQVQFEIEERAEGYADGNAKGTLKDSSFIRINDHVHLQMEGQSRCEAKGWSHVTLRKQSVALVEPFVTIIAKDESTVGLVTKENTLSDRIRHQDYSCVLLLPTDRGVEAFRKKYIANTDAYTIQEFVDDAFRQHRAEDDRIRNKSNLSDQLVQEPKPFVQNTKGTIVRIFKR